MRNFKNFFVYLLVFTLVLSVSLNKSTNAETIEETGILSEEAEKYNFELIENTDTIITAKAEIDGQVLFATLDKTTNEYSMKSVEKPSNIFGLGKEIVNEYQVEVEEISSDYQNVVAIVKDKDTGKKFKLEKAGGKDKKVKAQVPVLIPIATWAGSSLLAWLAMHAASITIAGVTAYAITTVWDKMKNSNYKYYTAYLDKGKTDVFVGPALKDKAAAIAHIRLGNSESYNVVATTQTLARELARDSGYVKTYTHHTNSQHGAGYYAHYHPIQSATWYSTYYGNKVLRKNHIWYR